LPKLSKFERDLLDAMVNVPNVTTAAAMLRDNKGYNTHDRNCYAALDNIRRKYEESLRYIGTINQYQQRSGLLHDRLSIRIKVSVKAKELPPEKA